MPSKAIRLVTITIRYLTAIIAVLVLGGLTVKSIFHGVVFEYVLWSVVGLYVGLCITGFTLYVRLAVTHRRKS